jgi:hypothetical protein
MTAFGRSVVAGIIVIVALVVVAVLYFGRGASMMPISTSVATSTPSTYGMTEYVDPTYGFTFWYPSSFTILASSTDDTTSFPGGTEVERLNLGPAGGVFISIVTSPQSTITDEPNEHAAPIDQTKYFYDVSSAQWMVAYPQGSPTGGSSATTTADVSKLTIGNLPMLPSAARFDTTIIPLSTTEFFVIGDGGDTSFTDQLAQTVALSGATIDPTMLSSALQAEAAAYATQ